MIDHGFKLGEVAQRELEGDEQWEIFSPAQMAILVFRFVPEDVDEEGKDEINARISKVMVESGKGGILTTKMGGKVALRICSISPELGEQEMIQVVKDSKEVANNCYNGYLTMLKCR